MSLELGDVTWNDPSPLAPGKLLTVSQQCWCIVVSTGRTLAVLHSGMCSEVPQREEKRSAISLLAVVVLLRGYVLSESLLLIELLQISLFFGDLDFALLALEAAVQVVLGSLELPRLQL